MTIVFGTTLRPDSEPFAEVASLLAQRLAVPLRLLHVSEDPRAPVVLGTDEEHMLGSVRETLSLEAQRLRSLTGAVVQPHLAGGSVADALVSVATWDLATALLVGSTLKPSNNPLGGVAERASRKSLVPVITLREPARMAAWLRGQRNLRILVGADLGQASYAAREFALKFGALGPSEIQVVLVASPLEVYSRLGLSGSESEEHSLSREAEEALLRELSRSAPPGEAGVALRVHPARGSPDAHLVTLAEQENVDLVIVGQRRRSVVERLWRGSVAQGVLHAAPISVACVPPSPGDVVPTFRAPRVIVVGLDFTEVDRRVLTQAVGLASEGGTVHLVHVVRQSGSAVEAREARERAFYGLSKLSPEGTEERSVSIDRHVLEGDPAEQILALAERVGADLLVLGARRRSALSRALLGSVAQSLTESAHVPLLLVPQEKP